MAKKALKKLLKKQLKKSAKMICTPNTGHPVLGVF